MNGLDIPTVSYEITVDEVILLTLPSTAKLSKSTSRRSTGPYIVKGTHDQEQPRRSDGHRTIATKQLHLVRS